MKDVQMQFLLVTMVIVNHLSEIETNAWKHLQTQKESDSS